MSENKTVFIKARVTPEDREKYNELAKKRGTTLSMLILKLLDEESRRD